LQTQDAPQRLPFRENTRQRIQRIPGALPAAFGTVQSVTLPQVGLLSRIFLFANLTIADAAATPAVTASSTASPYNALKRIRGYTNLGTATVFDMSGYGAYNVSKITDTCVDLKATNVDTVADPFLQYPVAGLVQNVARALQFVMMIPVSFNDGIQFAVGLINLQSPEIRFTLELTFGQGSDVYTTADVLTLGGAVQAYYEYYEVPDPDQVELPDKVFHRLLEERIAFNSTGDVTYLLPRMGILHQLIQIVTVNGAVDKSATEVSGRRLVFNKTDTPYSFDYIVDRILARYRYGLPGTSQDLPGGSYIWDFADSEQAPTRGDLRDAVDTEALSTLEAIVTVSGTPALGANNNFIDNVRRISQNY